jgi:hypothetical protein
MSTSTEEKTNTNTVNTINDDKIKTEEDTDNPNPEIESEKSEEEKKFDEEYLKYVKKAARLYKVLKENDDNQDSAPFIKLWVELETGLEVAQILDSALYPEEFSEMFSKNDQNKIKVIWNLAEIKRFDVGDIFTDRNKKNGLVVGVFKFTIWILFE